MAESAARKLTGKPNENVNDGPMASKAATGDMKQEEPAKCLPLARLSRGAQGPVLALQSEDHYVRVHGAKESELVLIRLRDAITEMNDVDGEQVHRSWWVATSGIAQTELTGRNWTIELTNGMKVPVARDSASRLRMKGMLPERLAG
jgi:DNA-binding LytR/AlgR family response regulator